MSATSSAAVTLITGTNAGAQVPYVSEWVQGSSTATYTLVGQILDNGQTNFVGYTEGEALYLLTTSAPGAEQTTLGNGQSYYVTSGSAPAGYLATDGGDASQTSGGGDASMTMSEDSSMSSGSSPSETSATTTDSSSTSESSSPTSDESASAQSSQPGAGSRVSVFSVGIGMTLFTALVFGVMA